MAVRFTPKDTSFSQTPTVRFTPKSEPPPKENIFGQFATGVAQGTKGMLPLDLVSKYGPQELRPVSGIMESFQKNKPIMGMNVPGAKNVSESFESVERYPKPQTTLGGVARVSGQLSPMLFGAKPAVQGLKALTGKTLLGLQTSAPQKAVNLSAKALEELNTARSFFNKGISDVIDQFPDEMIDVGKARSVVSSLPKEVIKNIRDTKIYDIKWLKGGTPQPTLRNMQKLKEAVGDHLSEGDWIKRPNDKKSISNAYSSIRDIMVDAKQELKPQLDAYHHFIKSVYSPLKNKLTRKGESVVSPILRTMTSAGEEADQAAIEAFKNITPNVKKTFGALSRYGRIKEVKKIPSRIPLVGGLFK